MPSGVAIGKHHRQRTLQAARCNHPEAETGAGVDYEVVLHEVEGQFCGSGEDSRCLVDWEGTFLTPFLAQYLQPSISRAITSILVAMEHWLQACFAHRKP
jgi:hypothetical protein